MNHFLLIRVIKYGELYRSADLDSDGLIDFVVASKSKYVYVFDINGLKSSYNANRYLIGTPVIGNIDNDSDLEIVVGGYSGSTSSIPCLQ